MLIVCPDALMLWGKVLVVDALADYGVTHMKCQSLPSALASYTMMVGHRHSDPRWFVVYGLNGDVR